MTLSICIPSVVGREEKLRKLLDNLHAQIERGKFTNVEVLTDVDNKQVSIGAKRQRMYMNCVGEYAVQIDDDDNVPTDYIQTVLAYIHEYRPDAIGYIEHCVMDGVEKLAAHSQAYGYWATLPAPDANGYSYYRTPYFKDVIKTEICRKVGVLDMRFAEDHDFAVRVLPLIKHEVFIPKIMYYYTANTLTKQEHKQRYGIK